MPEEQKDNWLMDNNNEQGVSPRLLAFLSLKLKKLTQATYLVTSNISDSEPLKWRLREAVLDILSDTDLLQPALGLSDIAESRQISPLFRTSVLESILAKLATINQLFEVAAAGNFLSEMNLQILRREYDKTTVLIKEKCSIGLTQLVGQGFDNQLAEKREESRGYKRQALTTSREVKDNVLGASSRRDNNRLNKEKTSILKDTRKIRIKNFLKGKGWMSIKDISDAIEDCSAKTIQRELSDMVSAGILKKKGDRRWSRYMLSDSGN